MSDVRLLKMLQSIDANPLDMPFWEACQRGEFLLHQCGTCGRSYWPASCCVDHGSANMKWIAGSGRGKIHTYTIVHQIYGPDFADRVPYSVAVVELDEGPFFHANIVDCDNDDIAVGLPVEVTFRERPDGISMPMFRLV